MGTGDINYERVAEDAQGSGGHEYIKCEECNGEGTIGTKNPLLEEYVDCLHFVLSIGNSIGYSSRICNVNLLSRIIKEVSVEKAFLGVFKSVAFLLTEIDDLGMAYHHYRKIFNGFNELGIALGFTPKEIEDAYMKKNAVNHLRQQEGY
ncbi:dUTP diphosphatase [Bacillus sp. FSL K6-2869]|nr:dUTP diphosphatase [Bacillus altitudinis]